MVEGRKLSLLEGTMAGLLFGTAAVFILLLREMNAFSIAFWRLIIASTTILFIVLVFQRRVNPSLIRKNLKHFLVLGILLGSHFMLFVSAVKNTSILNATVLVNTTPLFSMIVSTSLYSIKPSRKALVGLVLSLVGAGVIAYGDAQLGDPTSLIGDLEATLAAIAEGFYLNYGRGKRSQIPLLPTMLFIYLASALTVGVTTVVSGATFEFANGFHLILLLLGLGILSTATAHTLYFSSLSNLKSFETATMALLEPIGATILGVGLFAEIPTPIFIVGALLVLIGVFSLALEE